MVKTSFDNINKKNTKFNQKIQVYTLDKDSVDEIDTSYRGSSLAKMITRFYTSDLSTHASVSFYCNCANQNYPFGANQQAIVGGDWINTFFRQQNVVEAVFKHGIVCVEIPSVINNAEKQEELRKTVESYNELCKLVKASAPVKDVINPSEEEGKTSASKIKRDMEYLSTPNPMRKATAVKLVPLNTLKLQYYYNFKKKQTVVKVYPGFVKINEHNKEDFELKNIRVFYEHDALDASGKINSRFSTIMWQIEKHQEMKILYHLAFGRMSQYNMAEIVPKEEGQEPIRKVEDLVGDNEESTEAARALAKLANQDQVVHKTFTSRCAVAEQKANIFKDFDLENVAKGNKLLTGKDGHLKMKTPLPPMIARPSHTLPAGNTLFPITPPSIPADFMTMYNQNLNEIFAHFNLSQAILMNTMNSSTSASARLKMHKEHTAALSNELRGFFSYMLQELANEIFIADKLSIVGNVYEQIKDKIPLEKQNEKRTELFELAFVKIDFISTKPVEMTLEDLGLLLQVGFITPEEGQKLALGIFGLTPSLIKNEEEGEGGDSPKKKLRLEKFTE
jgi:hypothetical protein